MKIQCNRDALWHAFQTAASVAPSRSPKPILQNVKLDAIENRAVLLATDMEVGIRLEVTDVEVESPGSALLSVAQFLQILRESNEETLQIEADGNGVSVRGQRSRFKLPAANPAEFPSVSEFTEQRYHEISPSLLRTLIRRTTFATEAESGRYALGGVLLELEPDRVIAVATDGRRLATMQGPATSVNGHVTGDTMTIVPTRAMNLIDRAIADVDEDIKVASRGNDFVVSTTQVTLFSRLVEGRFPQWRDAIVERDDAVAIELTVGPLLAALRQAAVVTSQESRGIDFTFGNGQLVLQALTAEIGESRVEMPIPYDGKEIVLCLDHRFFADFLKVLDSERSFTMRIVDSDNAALCETDDAYRYVLMPLARDRKRKPQTAEAASAST